MTNKDRIAELLADFPVKVEVPVAWGDMDAMGHVNNIVYFRYFETARIDQLVPVHPSGTEAQSRPQRQCLLQNAGLARKGARRVYQRRRHVL